MRDFKRKITKDEYKVVEVNIPIYLSESDRVYYNKCSSEITDILSLYSVSDEFIFNLDGALATKFELITACNAGVRKTINGIPVVREADYYLYAVAAELGWGKDNDTTLEVYKAIEEQFHPNIIANRAKIFYDLVRTRNKMLSLHPDKLTMAYDFVKYFEDKRVVVFNDDTIACGRFANLINEDSNTDIRCNEYHTQLKSIPMLDDKGEFIRYKSGSRAGGIKMFGVVSRQRSTLAQFKSGECKVLSFGSNLYKSVDVDQIDVVIYIGCHVSKIKNLIYKAKPIKFGINKEQVYVINLYVADTLDQERFSKRQYSNNNKIIYCDSVKGFIDALEYRN